MKAARLACSLAGRFGSEVVMVHVYSFAVFAYAGSTPMPMPDVQPLEEAANAKGRSVLDRGLEVAKSEGVTARGELIEAPSIVQAILEYSEEQKADLIVVGTKGTTGFRRLVMGSVSSGLAGHARCPVLVVR